MTDIYGNISELDFNIKSTNNPFLNRCPLPKDTINTPFTINKVNIFKDKELYLHMEANSLYEPIMFHYETTDSIKGVFGKVHHVHFDNTPVHKKYVLSIKAIVPDSIKSKTYIANTDIKTNVSKGDIIGKVVDAMNGKILKEIIAPDNGFLFTLREHPIVYPGDLLARIALKEMD